MIHITDRPQNFDIEQIFDCGQCFRFNKHPQKNNTYCGIAFSKYLEISQDEKSIYLNGVTNDEYELIWKNYFDMSFDYAGVISSFVGDSVLEEASRFSSGIRILRQEPWEALCSFIISQNNNIPRIKGIIENMSKSFGEAIECPDGIVRYSFPTAKALCDAGEEKIFALKTGFRAKYIFDAASRVVNGDTDLERVFSLDTQTALDELMKIKGVGPKVASCVLLFGFGKYDAFPIDVWVKRILANYYSDGIPSHLSEKYAGIAQQYLFYYERCKNNVYL